MGPATITAREAAEPIGGEPSNDRERATAAADRAADRRERLLLYGGRLLVGVLVLGLWEFASGRWIDTFFVSSPSLVLVRLAELVSTGDLWPDLQATMSEFGLGLVIGVAAGLVLGLVLALSGVLGSWFYPYVMVLYSLPKVALAPLFVLWFGIGLTSKVAMVVSLVLFAVFYNVHEGVRNIDPDLRSMARSYRATRVQTLRWVILPSLAPWLLTALRLSVGLALIGTVIAELVGSSVGLGHYIQVSSNHLDITGVFAGLTVITVVAVTFDVLVSLLQRRLLHYR